MRDRDEWDDEEPEGGDESIEDDDAGDEDEIALSAVQAWLDIDGDDELAKAQREVLAAIAEEALAMKERREGRQRQEGRSRKLAERERRRGQERADLARQRREAWEQEQARRQREEEVRSARERAAERERREAERRAAQKRAEARARVERQAAERRAQEGRRAAPQRVPAAPEPPRWVPDDNPELVDDGDEADPAEEAPATETGWKAFEVPAAPDDEDEDAGADEPVPVRSRPAGTEPAGLTGVDLADWRKRRGLTQQAAADLLGVRQGTVSKAENRRGAALGQALNDALAGLLAGERGAA